MAIFDPQTVRGILVIVVIIWIFSGAGMRTLQNLIDKILDEL